MDVSKYTIKKGQPRTKPFAVPLMTAVEQELMRIRTEHNFNVRAWARDLITENLAELKKKLAG